MNNQTDNEQILVRRVSGFAGTFSREAVDAVCVDDTLDYDAVALLLTGSIERGVILRDELEPRTRYRLADAWRQLART